MHGQDILLFMFIHPKYRLALTDSLVCLKSAAKRDAQSLWKKYLQFPVDVLWNEFFKIC